MPAPPVDNLGFLLAKASQRWNELLIELLADAGYRQMRGSYGSVLLPLWHEDGLRLSALAQRARVTKQTMTTLTRLAERDGWVTRRNDPTDGRATQVWLTEAAIALAPVALGAVTALHQRVEAALGPTVTTTVRHALATVMDLEMERDLT